MNRIFIDTSAWYAFIDKNDPDHKESEKLYKSNTKPLITSNFIFDETVTLLMSRLGFDIAVKFGESLKKSNFVNIIRITDEDEDNAWRIFLKYKNSGFSYTDCTSFAAMHRLKIDTAFTFDKHFAAMRFNILG